MKRLQPVIWSKGTFLSPQHLQLQDRFLENLLQFHIESLSFRPWGFRSLQINQEALAAGAFGISSASGMLPDGLLFDIPGSDAAPPLKPLRRVLRAGPDLARRLPRRAAIPRARIERRQLDAPRQRPLPGRDRAVPRREHRSFREARPGSAHELPALGWKASRSTAIRTCGPRASSRPKPTRFSSITRFVPPLLDFKRHDYLVGHRAPPGGNSDRAVQHHRRCAPPEKSEPRRFHRRRHRQFLAALHRQYGVSRSSGTCSKRAAAIPRSCTRPCSRWPAR